MIKVLLVDDNEINLEIQSLMLEGCGLDVTTADSGETAVELAGKQDFSLIFMDINMPEMDGYTACGLIRKKNKSVPVIALSADRISADDSRFTESGMSGSLLKPLQINELKELLSKYINIDSAETVHDSDDVIFDYDELIAVMKDEKAVLRVLKQFLSIHNRDCEILTEYAENGNFIGAREILHNITGISGNMFCKRLYRLSCSLSAELKQERYYSLKEFTEVWNLTFKALSECHINLSEKYPSDDYKSDWKTLWESFFSLACEFDISAVDIFTENIQSFMANMNAEKFKKLKKYVLNYDFLWISENMQEV